MNKLRIILSITLVALLSGCTSPDLANGNKVNTFSNIFTLDVGDKYVAKSSDNRDTEVLTDNSVSTFSRLLGVRIGDTYELTNTTIQGSDFRYLKGMK